MPPMVGQISLFSFDFNPAGWMFCEGQLLPIAENETLFQLLGTTYGGDGEDTFGLPDLRAAAPAHLHYAISLFGSYGTDNFTYDGVIGETMVAIPSLAARNLLQCTGQSMLSNSYPLLNVYMGNRFGGDATHFNLPDLRSIAPSKCQYRMCVQGSTPDNLNARTPFLGEIFLLPYQQTVETLLLCNGAQLPIAANTALYNLIGTTFGGSGSNFALPNLTAPKGYSYYIAYRQVVYPPRG